MKPICRACAILAVICLGSTLAVAQENAAGKPVQSKEGKVQEKRGEGNQAAPAGQGMPAMPQPAPEMQKIIKMFAGAWTTAEKFEPSDYMPKGGTGAGAEMTKAGPGGYSLLNDYRSRGEMGVGFAGHGIVYWDAKSQAYKSVWCDSMSAQGCEVGATGKWEGNDLVFTAEGEMMGKKFQMRQVYTDIQPDSYTFYIDSSTDGGPMKRTLTIHYTRMKPPRY